MMPRACAAWSASASAAAMFHELGRVERATSETLLQRLPFEQFHDEKPAACVDADIMNGADVRMIDAGDRLGLSFESASAAESPDVASGRILRRPLAAGDVACAIHLPHPSGPEEADEYRTGPSRLPVESDIVNPGTRRRIIVARSLRRDPCGSLPRRGSSRACAPAQLPAVPVSPAP